MTKYIITNRGTCEFLGLVLRTYAKTANESPIGRERALILADRIGEGVTDGLEFFTLGNEGADLEAFTQIQADVFKPLPTLWVLTVRECYTASPPRIKIKAATVWDLFQQAVKKDVKLPPGLLQWAGSAGAGEKLHIESVTWAFDLEVIQAEG